MSEKVFITGLGLISAIGNNVEECFTSLKNKKTGIGNLEVLDSVHKKEYKAAEIKISNAALAKKLNIGADKNYPRTTLLAIAAAQEACDDAGLSFQDGFRTGVICGTTVGGMDKSERFYRSEEPCPDFIESHSCGYTTEQVADYLGVKDFVSSISTACSSGANALFLGARLIKHGVVDRVIAGGADALSKFTLNGFRSLMILSTDYCQPFDKNRKGLNLGEGAGFVVLESETLVKKKNQKVLAELVGYGNANDAFHQTASSPEGNGPFLCMKKALAVAGLKPEDIDYVNVHGTGTENNDFTESVGLQRIFGESIPPFSSTKTYTGHTLGAAGAIEAVFSVLAINHGVIFPNLFFDEPMSEPSLSPEIRIREEKNVDCVMSNSFGFGGNDTSVIIRKV